MLLESGSREPFTVDGACWRRSEDRDGAVDAPAAFIAAGYSLRAPVSQQKLFAEAAIRLDDMHRARGLAV